MVNLKCPECGKKYGSALALGNHRWQAHKIRGESYDARKRAEKTVTRYERTPDGLFQCPLCEFAGKGAAGMGMHMKMHRAQGDTALAPTNNPHPERNAIVKTNQHAETTNGAIHHQAQDDANHRLEAAATLAAGRVQELCSRLAFEHDLPPRTLTALVLRTVASASSLR
jgi:hypothetical protein